MDAANSDQKQCFGYDTLNRLTSAAVGDNLSGCTGSSGGNGEYTDESYSYNATTGNLASKTGMGTYTYPGATQPRPHAVTSTTTGWSYAYDANGNMTHRAQQEADYYDFVYDAANRLSQAKKNGSLVAKFTYDGDGKRVKSEGAYKNLAAGVVATSPSGVSSPGRITDGSLATGFAQTGGTGLSYVQLDLGAVYTVDKVKVWHYYSDGRTYHNTKTQVSADGVNWTTVFDSATSGEYPETSAGKMHTFSAQGVRYVRDYTNGSSGNIWNHWVEIEVWGTSNTVFVGGHYEVTDGAVTKYYMAGSQRIAMRQNGTLYWLLSDHLGSTSVVANTNGALHSQQMYTPWGVTRYTSVTALPTKYQYTGQYSYATSSSADFGLMFYNARWYDPYITQFSQPDTLVPDQYNTLDWNRYQYARYNPLRYNDPSGHASCDEIPDAEGQKACKQNEKNDIKTNNDPPIITVNAEHGLCINVFNIGCSGTRSNDIEFYSWYLPNLPGYIGDDFSQISTTLQDIALGFSMAGASFEIAGATAGGPGGLEIGYAMYLSVFNPAESFFSSLSTGATIMADGLQGNTYVNVSQNPLSVNITIGEATVTSVAGSYAGSLVPEGILDSLIDGYMSNYSHGNAPGLPAINITIPIISPK